MDMNFFIPYLSFLKLISCIPLINDSAKEATVRQVRAQPFPFVGQLTSRNATTESPLAAPDDSEPFSEDALKDIAYYLRAHKFNEYDRRYHPDAKKASRDYFGKFPRPPLRSLHWEVHKFCEPSFVGCVNYLHSRVMGTGLRRVDDTAVVIQQQNWTITHQKGQIDSVESECKTMQQVDDRQANPFEGPLERFQWRTTASYFMCWYTMKEVSYLKHLKEECDNFASCLDKTFGASNKDVRAVDATPFFCALYSFCPDPCCPQKHLANAEICWEGPDNPCFETNSPGQRECVLRRSENTQFTDMLQNRWNVSCKCPWTGYVWDSRYGICVDMDECLKNVSDCDVQRESCVNLVGTHTCACQWGYFWSNGRCNPSPALNELKLKKKDEKEEEKDRPAQSVIKQLFRYIFYKSSANYHKKNCVLWYLYLILIYVHT